MEWIRSELRYSVRGLRKSPSFTISVILTLAVGIGVNAAMYGVVSAFLLRAPALVQRPDEVVRVYFTRTIPAFGTTTQRASSVPLYARVREEAHAFVGVAALFETRVSIGSGEAAQQVSVGIASANLFPLLGVRVASGRFFVESEDRTAGRANVAVLSDGLARSRYGGAAAALGKTIDIGQHPYTIIGVAPAGFSGLALAPTDLWLPLAAAADQGKGRDWASPMGAFVEVLGRIRPGVRREAADRELTAIFRASDPLLASDKVASAAVAPLQLARGPRHSPAGDVSLWLLGMAAVVLLIACANISGLLVQRSMRRSREVAIRIALGVSRMRLATQLLLESALLALAGGILAIVVSYATGRVLRSLFFREGEIPEGVVNGRILAVTVTLTLLAAFGFGLLPLRHALRRDLVNALKPGVRGSSGRGRGHRSLLLAGQVASSIMLLIGAALFLQSSLKLARLDLGFDTDQVLAVKLGSSLANEPARAARLRATANALGALPGVTSVGFSQLAPLGGAMSYPVSVPGIESVPQAPGGGPFVNAVTAEYFRTVGIPILRGNTFQAGDPTHDKGLVINQTMARLLWPHSDAIGKCIRLISSDSPCRDVIGVVGDTRNFSVREEASMQMYTAMGSGNADQPSALLVRTRGPADGLAAAVRRALYASDPGLPYLDVRSLASTVEPQVRPVRSGATLLVVFGAAALLLTTIGLYGSVAYAAAQRRREIGIHLALGAAAGAVVRSVMSEGAGALTVGVLAGLAGSTGLMRLASGVLYEVPATDPATYACVTLFLGCVCLLACYLPARAAAFATPGASLRDE